MRVVSFAVCLSVEHSITINDSAAVCLAVEHSITYPPPCVVCLSIEIPPPPYVRRTFAYNSTVVCLSVKHSLLTGVLAVWREDEERQGSMNTYEL
jgi:hypothetical protein